MNADSAAEASCADDSFDDATIRNGRLDLPDEVLRKIYYRNALRIIPGIDRSLFPE